uniref:Uncharacterized protein n=1 Tax=Candidatus Kentrum sp. MB TaxID=2138164 RepID=A0A450XLU5_9GAMM|nr:MAG: hypothetical protein BECKMB1821G_GA0114241_106211 [Candidatus Kentron sp. MB]
MSTRSHPSSFAWFMSYVVFPLVPFFLKGIIRIIVFGMLDLGTFRSSTLAMSMGILCLFVNRSLISHEAIIHDNTGKMVGIIHIFSWLAIFFFVFFGIVVFSSALMERTDFSNVKIIEIKHALDIIILSGALVPVSLSLWTQRSFNLRATS